MEERRLLGNILLESGRITQSDVERVLDYQQTHGGFFGQGLVALGIVTREEIDWALASQHDLPFIFPNANAIDHDVARMVPPDWALAHLAVPIVRVGRTLTVVVADPLRRDVIDELRALTTCDVEMALASSQRIRELIHAIYHAHSTPQLDTAAPISLQSLMTDAIDHAAERFGISIRAGGAIGWWRSRAESRRAPLLEGWEDALTAAVDPSPLGRLDGPSRWDAILHRVGGVIPLEVQAMPGGGGAELMFRPLLTAPPVAVSASIVLPATLVTELRLLWRAGAASIGFSSGQIELARALLPLLPALALGTQVRAAHINSSGNAGATYALRAAADESFADDVAAYGFDVLTIDLPVHGFPVRALLRAAPLTFMLLDEPQEHAVPADWGINWLLSVSGQPGSYSWDLRALIH